jgi:hypothetical protein
VTVTEVMADFDESLPSHSVFVPHTTVSRSTERFQNASGEEKPKKTFLKKGRYAYNQLTNFNNFNGSRQEPSALMKAKTVRGGVVTAATSDVDDWKASQSSYHDSPSRTNALPSTSLDESTVSNSSYLLGDTSSSELQQRYLQEKRNSQLELDEFVMIERDLENIAVTPILSSIDGFPLTSQSGASTSTSGQTYGGSANGTSRGVRESSVSSGTSTMRAAMASTGGTRGADWNGSNTFTGSRRTDGQGKDWSDGVPTHTSSADRAIPVYSLADDLDNYSPRNDFTAAARAASSPGKAQALQSLHRKIKSSGGPGLRTSGDSATSGWSAGSRGSRALASSRHPPPASVGDGDDNNYDRARRGGSDHRGGRGVDGWSGGSEEEEEDGGAGGGGDVMDDAYRDSFEEGEEGEEEEEEGGEHKRGYVGREYALSDDGDDGGGGGSDEERSWGKGVLMATTELHAIPPQEQEEEEGDGPGHVALGRQETEVVYGSSRGRGDSWGSVDREEEGEEVVDDSKTWSSERGDDRGGRDYSVGRSTGGGGGSREQHRYSYSRGSQNEVGAIGGGGADSEWSIRKSGSAIASRPAVGARPAVRPSSAGATRSSRSGGAVGSKGRASTGSRSSSREKESGDGSAMLGSSLSKKAKELEEEIETYR